MVKALPGEDQMVMILILSLSSALLVCGSLRDPSNMRISILLAIGIFALSMLMVLFDTQTEVSKLAYFFQWLFIAGVSDLAGATIGLVMYLLGRRLA